MYLKPFLKAMTLEYESKNMTEYQEQEQHCCGYRKSIEKWSDLLPSLRRNKINNQCVRWENQHGQTFDLLVTWPLFFSSFSLFHKWPNLSLMCCFDVLGLWVVFKCLRENLDSDLKVR